MTDKATLITTGGLTEYERRMLLHNRIAELTELVHATQKKRDWWKSLAYNMYRSEHIGTVYQLYEKATGRDSEDRTVQTRKPKRKELVAEVRNLRNALACKSRDLTNVTEQLNKSTKGVQERNVELERVKKERDDIKKVAFDHAEISTCVNEYRHMKANKHLFNSEQQDATYEQIVDKLLKCVKE